MIVAMKMRAEKHLNVEVTHATITVPTCFNDAQVQAVRDAGEIAGLETIHTISETSAVTFPFLCTQHDLEGDEQEVVVLSLGGAHCCVNVCNFDGGICEVKATVGDAELGGDDFDRRLVDHFIDEFKQKNGGRDLRESQRALRQLRTACERAKRTLSSAPIATVEIDALYQGIDFRASITRDKFESLCVDLLRRTREMFERVSTDAKVHPLSVAQVILVGGASRIRAVQTIASKMFPRAKLNTSMNPDEAMVGGAACSSFIHLGGKSKQTEGLLLMDVTAKSLGIATSDGKMVPLLKRNTTIPTKKSQIFSTEEDNQTCVSIPILEGEDPMAKNCNHITTLHLQGIAPVPRKVPQIEVIFDHGGASSHYLKAEGWDRKSNAADSIDVSLVREKLRPSKIRQKRLEMENCFKAVVLQTFCLSQTLQSLSFRN